MKLTALFNSDLRHQINTTLFFDADKQDTDVAIILGGGSLTGETARALSQSTSPYPMGILLSGGIKIRQPHVYYGLRALGADVRYEDCTNSMIENGYAYSCLSPTRQSQVIFSDGKSTNTGENLANLAQKMSNIGARTATIYCAAPMQRRAIDTAHVHIPNIDVITKPIFPWFSKEFWLNHWHKNPVSAHYVLSEFKKIDPKNPRNYYERGFCTRTPQ